MQIGIPPLQLAEAQRIALAITRACSTYEHRVRNATRERYKGETQGRNFTWPQRFDAHCDQKVAVAWEYNDCVAQNEPSRVPMLDFGREYFPLREEILAAIAAVCDSQSFISGPAVASFERAAAKWCGVADAVGCSSGTEALWLSLAALGIGGSTESRRMGRQDAVVTTPFSFFATASSILRAGAKPMFADIDPRTFNLSVEAVRTVLAEAGDAARAVLPVHLYGQPADMDGFRALQRERDEVVLVEDAAQAFGAAWRFSDGTVVPAGALGDAAAFSFYPTKNLAAFGDAGMMTSRSQEATERARALRAHGMRRRYYHDEVGWNSRMDGIQGAVLEVKLKYVAQGNERRLALAQRYDCLFREAGLAAPDGGTDPTDGVVLPWTDPRAKHVFHQYVVRVPRRDALREFLKTREIGSEVYYPVPLHLQDALRDLGYREGAFPEAERASREVLALPIFPALREEEQDCVVDAICAFYR